MSLAGNSGHDGSLLNIIVPTLAQSERRPLLMRAFDSLWSQAGVTVAPIVVVNGPQADADIVRSLASDSRITLLRLEQPSLPNALLAGRARVTTELFGTLDDDDLLLPGALAARVATLTASPEIDAVVSNGIRRSNEGDYIHIPNLDEVREDPMRSLFRSNWLLPGSWLARADRLGVSAFEGMERCGECTHLGIRLSMMKLAFLAEPGIVWFTDTPGGEHRHPDALRHMPLTLEALKRLPIPSDVRRVLDEKTMRAQHRVAGLELRAGNHGQAWRWHLKSLCHPGGWRYLSFTRHLLRGRVPLRS